MSNITSAVVNSEEYSELVEKHGNEYLGDRCPDDQLYEMDDIDHIVSGSPSEIIQMAANGGRWTSMHGVTGDFECNSSYFTFDGYGNLVSVDGCFYLDYLLDHIDDKDDFVEFLISNWYIDESDYEEEEEECEEVDEDEFWEIVNRRISEVETTYGDDDDIYEMARDIFFDTHEEYEKNHPDVAKGYDTSEEWYDRFENEAVSYLFEELVKKPNSQD